MGRVIASSHLDCDHCQSLIKEVYAIWDEWDLQEKEQFRKDKYLNVVAFYNGFMAHYFVCFSCDDTYKERFTTNKI